MNIHDKIRAFGSHFTDRLDNELLNYAIDYVSHNEPELAFETVCEHLCEYQVSISQDEYEEALAIAKILNIPSDDLTVTYLKKLIHVAGG